MLLKLITFLSREAFACAVCGYGKDGAQAAFLYTTLLMTAIPLLMGGGIIYYLYRRSKASSSITSTSPQNHQRD